MEAFKEVKNVMNDAGMCRPGLFAELPLGVRILIQIEGNRRYGSGDNLIERLNNRDAKEAVEKYVTFLGDGDVFIDMAAIKNDFDPDPTSKQHDATFSAEVMAIEEAPSAEELRKYERFVEKTDLFLKNSGEQEMHGILSLIFDYEKCNDYAKAIMEKSTFPMQPSDNGLKDSGKSAFSGGNGFKDDEEKLHVVRQFAQSCIQSGNYEAGCRLVFWALMVLTVDESDAEKHLDLICNLAEMLCITDDELEDIVQLVKAAYSEATPEYEFKSRKIPGFFQRFIDACGWKVDETAA